MTHELIEKYRIKLTDILADDYPMQNRTTSLKELARKVGASRSVIGRSTGGNIGEAELVENIHNALQTASMIAMCKTATEGYEIATKASRNARIHFWIAAAIAFICAMAAWVAAIRN